VPCAAAFEVRETDDPTPFDTTPPPHAARRRLARALRWHRTLNGWSQEALGLAAGLDRTYVGAVERMEVNISMDNAEKLARAFGLELVDLLETNEQR
jgi:ribosome-binding protein aMBF1 (putative translation factor)